jgi:hypothetical protein
MNKITVTNQVELDVIVEDFQGEIHITGELERITKHYKNAFVYVYGNAQISNVYGNAQISNVYGNAQISYVYGNAQIRYVGGNAQIRYVGGNAQISYVYGNAQISNVYGNAQISYVYGNAVVLHCSGEASIQTLGQNIISYSKSQTKLKIDASSNTTIVILDEINSTSFDGYKKFYPFEVINDNAILYKAVHKTSKGKFVSDKDRDFEYIIGETKIHDCNPTTDESCTFGLHVSHKMWALRFGCSWDDMALIEVKVPIDKIVVAKDCDGKVRTSELTVIREVPEEEWYK